MTCPRCHGFCVVDEAIDFGLVLRCYRCINCAWRSYGRTIPAATGSPSDLRVAEQPVRGRRL